MTDILVTQSGAIVMVSPQGGIDVTQVGALIMMAPLAPINVTQVGAIVMVKNSEIDTGVSSQMISHLALGTTYLCTLWKLTASDGTIVRGCNHTRNVTFENELYKAVPIDPSQLSKSSNLNPSNADVVSPYLIGGVNKSDIKAKKWNNAKIEVVIVNYLNPSMGPARRDVGFIGEIRLEKSIFTASYEGMASKLAQEIGEIETPDCRAVLGDSRCMKDLTNFTHSVEVIGVSVNYPNRIFEIDLNPSKANSYFKRGKATVTSGVNNNVQRDIKDSWGNIIELVIPLSKPIEIGDTFTLVAGCDGTRTTCKNTFDNVINIQAAPDLPGIETVYTFPEN